MHVCIRVLELGNSKPTTESFVPAAGGRKVSISFRLSEIPASSHSPRVEKTRSVGTAVSPPQQSNPQPSHIPSSSFPITQGHHRNFRSIFMTSTDSSWLRILPCRSQTSSSAARRLLRSPWPCRPSLAPASPRRCQRPAPGIARTHPWLLPT